MNCLEARSFAVRLFEHFCKKLHMYITFAKELYSIFFLSFIQFVQMQASGSKMATTQGDSGFKQKIT